GHSLLSFPSVTKLTETHGSKSFRAVTNLLQTRGCGRVEKDASSLPARERRRRFLRRRLSERPLHRLCLVRPGDQEDDLRHCRDRRQRESHALDERLEPGLSRDHEPLTLVECRRVREEGGG